MSSLEEACSIGRPSLPSQTSRPTDWFWAWAACSVRHTPSHVACSWDVSGTRATLLAGMSKEHDSNADWVDKLTLLLIIQDFVPLCIAHMCTSLFSTTPQTQGWKTKMLIAGHTLLMSQTHCPMQHPSFGSALWVSLRCPLPLVILCHVKAMEKLFLFSSAVSVLDFRFRCELLSS